ncbi:MAG: hypothetical protein PHC88_10210 [Terrimicrobiaceae bacterium]|nr:hypothetical protein [Terrimicrobiaceae bacterium]
MTPEEIRELVPNFDNLPGAEWVGPGLADAAHGRNTPAACLIWLAAPRLQRAGLIDESFPAPISEPERALYALLQTETGDAFSKYNALLRRLVSFEHALSDRSSRAARSTPQP